MIATSSVLEDHYIGVDLVARYKPRCDRDPCHRIKEPQNGMIPKERQMEGNESIPESPSFIVHPPALDAKNLKTVL